MHISPRFRFVVVTAVALASLLVLPGGAAAVTQSPFRSALQDIMGGLDPDIDLFTFETLPSVVGEEGNEVGYNGESRDDAIPIVETTLFLVDSDVNIFDIWLAGEPTTDGRVVIGPEGSWMAAANVTPPSGQLGDFVFVGVQTDQNVLDVEFGDVGVYVATPGGVLHESPFPIDPNDGTDRSWNMFFADRWFVQGWRNVDGTIVADNDSHAFAVGQGTTTVLALPREDVPEGSTMTVWTSNGFGLDNASVPPDFTQLSISNSSGQAGVNIETLDADADPGADPVDGEAEPGLDSVDGDADDADQEPVLQQSDDAPSGSSDDPSDQEARGATTETPVEGDQSSDDPSDGPNTGTIVGGVFAASVFIGGGLFLWQRRKTDGECEEEWRNWQAALVRTAELESERDSAARRRADALDALPASDGRSEQSWVEAQQRHDGAQRDLESVEDQLERERQNVREWKRLYDLCAGAQTEGEHAAEVQRVR